MKDKVIYLIVGMLLATTVFLAIGWISQENKFEITIKGYWPVVVRSGSGTGHEDVVVVSLETGDQLK